MAEYIERDIWKKLPDDLPYKASVKRVLIEAPAADVVSRVVLEQIRWERDVAMKQLEDHGIPFGGIAPDVVEVVRCKDCKHTRERNDYEKQYLVDGVLICTSPDVADDCWQAVWPEHFCSYGERKDDGN